MMGKPGYFNSDIYFGPVRHANTKFHTFTYKLTEWRLDFIWHAGKHTVSLSGSDVLFRILILSQQVHTGIRQSMNLRQHRENSYW